ncbi:cupin domain-containing protein [Streptomyces sp. NPDC048606]|uniref:cupin domain-containing protein n=1 Tax=Streptomyces sp. NPDC048606 TaxID=3154726 RepID=UPI00343A86DE
MSIDMRTWKAFAAAHAPGFSRPVFLPGLVTDPQRLGRLIDRSLRTATRRAPGDLRLRAFRPGAFDYRLTKRFVDSPLADDESAVEWLARTAGDDEACVAVNDVSAWDLGLSTAVSEIVEELVTDGVHELLSGTDAYTFIAHSGWTPFGIHKDDEPSLIFHLGPSAKEVWIWHENPFDASRTIPSPSFGHISFDIDEHLGSADRYLLRPGDFLLIPQDTHHVFRNLGPSVFLGLTPYPARTRSVITEALWRAAGPADPLPAYPPATAVADRARALLTEDTAHPPLAERVAHELALGRLRLRTNGHLGRPHRAALPDSGAAVTDGPLRWSRPGAVAVAAHAGRTTLVVRGRSVTVPVEDRAAFDALVRATASTAPFSFPELTALLPAGLAPDSRAELARTLYTLGAVIAA